MDVRELAVPGAFRVTPRRHHDHRGVFLESYRADVLAQAVGHPLRLAQSNCSVSARGVLRGVHVVDVPPGQAKYVTCPRGAVFDVVVDLRVGSPSFGTWDAAVLDDRDHRAVYVAEGIGHAFMALTDHATVSYLCSEPYAPSREHTVHPFDAELAIRWPGELAAVLSSKDSAARGLTASLERGVLPSYDACQALYARQHTRSVRTLHG